MKPLPLRVRVLGALELAPMTVFMLSTSLDVSQISVQHKIDDLRRLGVIAKCAVERGREGRPWNVYGIAA